MIVVDLRSRIEQALARPGDRPDRPWHGLAGRVTDALVRRRLASRAAPPSDLLVVSIGNLRMGGTGKTPLVLQLARDLAAAGLGGGVVTRGYRADDPTPRIVTDGDLAAGDEARLLASRLAPVGWPVAQAADRARGLELLRAAVDRPQVVLLEDAFQTGGVGRHCDVLVVDRWRWTDAGFEPLAGPTLPFGPYRETAAGARRADVWLVEDLDRPAAPGESCVPLLGFRRQVRLGPGAAEELARGPVGLVSALARPERFEAGCRDLLSAAPRLSVRLADHGAYDEAVGRRLAELARDHEIAAWLTTAKDRVKLGATGPGGLPLHVVELAVVWTTTPTLPEVIGERRQRLAQGGPAF